LAGGGFWAKGAFVFEGGRAVAGWWRGGAEAETEALWGLLLTGRRDWLVWEVKRERRHYKSFRMKK